MPCSSSHASRVPLSTPYWKIINATIYLTKYVSVYSIHQQIKLRLIFFFLLLLFETYWKISSNFYFLLLSNNNKSLCEILKVIIIIKKRKINFWNVIIEGREGEKQNHISARQKRKKKLKEINLVVVVVLILLNLQFWRNLQGTLFYL